MALQGASSGFSFPQASSYGKMRADLNSLLRVSTARTTCNSAPARKEKELIRSRPEIDKPGLQRKDQTEVDGRLGFGHFVAREAQFDEEYWSAAWLRAESHFEGREDDRYVDSYLRRFAEQEFNAMKRRYNTQQLGGLCKCIVAVVNKDQTNAKTIENVLGTLDLSIGYLSQGETFPGDRVKTPLFYFVGRTNSITYGYIFNLCVAKTARRHGVARRMLRYAILAAKANGAEKVFVHVHRDNEAARRLYQEMGFEVVVEAASSRFPDDQIELLCINLGYFTDN